MESAILILDTAIFKFNLLLMPKKMFMPQSESKQNNNINKEVKSIQ